MQINNKSQPRSEQLHNNADRITLTVRFAFALTTTGTASEIRIIDSGTVLETALFRFLQQFSAGENSVLTISSLINGYYGIGDLCMSLPVVLSQNGIQGQLFMELSDQEVAMFQYSAKKLKEVIEQFDEVYATSFVQRSMF